MENVDKKKILEIIADDPILQQIFFNSFSEKIKENSNHNNIPYLSKNLQNSDEVQKSINFNEIDSDYDKVKKSVNRNEIDSDYDEVPDLVNNFEDSYKVQNSVNKVDFDSNKVPDLFNDFEDSCKVQFLVTPKEFQYLFNSNKVKNSFNPNEVPDLVKNFEDPNEVKNLADPKEVEYLIDSDSNLNKVQNLVDSDSDSDEVPDLVENTTYAEKEPIFKNIKDEIYHYEKIFESGIWIDDINPKKNLYFEFLSLGKVAKKLKILKMQQEKISFYLNDIKNCIRNNLIVGKFEYHFVLDSNIVTQEFVDKIIKIINHNNLQSILINKTIETITFEFSL